MTKQASWMNFWIHHCAWYLLIDRKDSEDCRKRFYVKTSLNEKGARKKSDKTLRAKLFRNTLDLQQA